MFKIKYLVNRRREEKWKRRDHSCLYSVTFLFWICFAVLQSHAHLKTAILPSFSLVSTPFGRDLLTCKVWPNLSLKHILSPGALIILVRLALTCLCVWNKSVLQFLLLERLGSVYCYFRTVAVVNGIPLVMGGCMFN